MSCNALTGKGSNCSRKSVVTLNEKGYCLQHSKIKQREIQRADPVWQQLQLEKQKKAYEEEQILFHRLFGYKKMGLLYRCLGGDLIGINKKQSVLQWFLIGKRLRLGKDVTNHIAYLLLRILQ